MCSRYRLDNHWLRDPDMGSLRITNRPDEFGPDGSTDCAPSTWCPVLRRNDANELAVEARRWGFHRHYPDADRADQRVKREHFIADATQVTTLPSFKFPFAVRRCLIPMSAWSEWRRVDGKKTRVEVSMPARPVFAVAGLYETSQDIRTGESIETFIILTSKPVHGGSGQAAPLVLSSQDYEPWLDDREAAQRLVGSRAAPSDFRTTPQKTSLGELFPNSGPAELRA